MATKPNTNEKEIWKDVLGWEGLYKVSSFGRVKSLPRTIVKFGKTRQLIKYPVRGRVLAQATHTKGYKVVVLSDTQTDRGRVSKRVHRLVCEAFYGECPDKHEAAHADGTRDNNYFKNLRWATHLDNIRDKVKHGTARRKR